MPSYEVRYQPGNDTVAAIVDGRIVKEFTCAYRGQVKATYIAQSWLGLPASYPPAQPEKDKEPGHA